MKARVSLKYFVSYCRSGKLNILLNFINYQHNIDKMYLYTKDPHEVKYLLLIKKMEKCRFLTLK